MPSFRPLDWIAVGLAFVLSLVLTPLVGAVARRRGFVARPKSDRWHKKPTALLGGVAIVAAVVPAWAVFGPHAPEAVAVGLAAAALGAVGLVDDLAPIRPLHKLIAQTAAAAAVVIAGSTLPWTPWPIFNVAVTVFWLVGVTNAVNLLDNMDGLAAGVSAIAAAALAACLLGDDRSSEAVLPAGLAAALLGFLVWNWNPASIFMGDCGSLFVGFLLAGSAVLYVNGVRPDDPPAAAVPVLVLAVPIFDTTFVTLMRKRAGRAVSQGGRDHTSHRLVKLGLSERAAAVVLYALAALSGGLALLARRLPPDAGAAAVLGLGLLLVLLGVRLAAVRVYE